MIGSAVGCCLVVLVIPIDKASSVEFPASPMLGGGNIKRSRRATKMRRENLIPVTCPCFDSFPSDPNPPSPGGNPFDHQESAGATMCNQKLNLAHSRIRLALKPPFSSSHLSFHSELPRPKLSEHQTFPRLTKRCTDRMQLINQSLTSPDASDCRKV